MSRFLFTVWPFTGHIHPNLAIAQQLIERGHEVAFYTGESARSAVEGEKCRFFGLRRVNGELVDRIALSGEGILSAQNKPWRLLALYRQWLLDTVPDQVADIEEVLREWQPAAIVCDPTLWAPFLVLHEKLRIPVAVFSLIPACHLSGRDAPILGFPLPRARGTWQRLGKAALRKSMEWLLAGTRRAASRMRRTYGLSPLDRGVTDHAATMPLYLVPSSPEFDYQRTDLPASVRYVGPSLRPPGRTDSAPLEGIPTDRPWIFVSEGTVHLDPKLLRCAAQGLAGLPLEVILATGKHRDADRLNLGPRPLAPNIHVRSWVDLNSLLPRLSALINIGGPSTIMAALNESIPVVIAPFAWDHPETGFRIQESGAGIHIKPGDLTPRSLRAAVELILRDPSYRRNATRLALSFERLGGARRAADLVEEMIDSNEASVGGAANDGVKARV